MAKPIISKTFRLLQASVGLEAKLRTTSQISHRETFRRYPTTTA